VYERVLGNERSAKVSGVSKGGHSKSRG